ncbi:hypothetical protein L1987_25889 [Smallanthus sonchifolius]|uniref:Uncharacterized protein n=1 Tax=Smallanthus sonchifolius TaxID=185202 RepID=A0ACB9I8R9_9ASTR|nr:hypothetical protein L1987_25889 [Smallanthus sonchifolius]
MTCCKEKVVLVAVYEEKPKKRRLTTRKNDNIKHHHHHHLHVHPSKNGEGNRRAELLSYSQRLREASKLKASTPDSHCPKSLVASITNNQETKTQVHDVQKEQKLKKKSRPLDMKSILKCFAMSHAKRKVKKKKKKKKSMDSTSNKANVMMKRFNARTQKGARRFFSKLKAFIQKHR